MACHEITGLRLGLMNVLGVHDPKEKQHELAELGDAATKPGPVASMLTTQNLIDLKKLYKQSLTLLAQKVAKMPAKDPKLGYYRALMVSNKKIEMELDRLIGDLNSFYKELDEMHNFMHEVFPE